MQKSETQQHQQTLAYSSSRNKCCPKIKKKGDRSFIEGCLFALCCCWLCEVCF
ncbi:hypothetical protein Patl1_20875 [Pistacia atlantica]|uniref:Uncharacterized protein n=1 Tax=Pistacia atlantica TaxID=434234 RepID=A0ACC1BJX8_9ROSI|nr:hypothetical protein Patl1_20875 [Pistacia atlantica]